MFPWYQSDLNKCNKTRELTNKQEKQATKMYNGFDNKYVIVRYNSVVTPKKDREERRNESERKRKKCKRGQMVIREVTIQGKTYNNRLLFLVSGA